MGKTGGSLLLSLNWFCLTMSVLSKVKLNLIVEINKSRNILFYKDFLPLMAEWTGLEPATPGVTGRYSNQLNYHSW